MTELSQADLLQAVKDTLNNGGHLDRFKAEMRSVVLELLNQPQDASTAPTIPEETRFINELIREYLAWNGYIYSEQLLSVEANQSNERLNRDVLATKLGVVDNSKTAKVPLLYYIVAAFKNESEED